MSNMLTLMVVDSKAWFSRQSWPLRVVGRLVGVLAVYRIGYEAGWNAAVEVGSRPGKKD